MCSGIKSNVSVYLNSTQFRDLTPRQVDEEVSRLSEDQSEEGTRILRAALAAKIRNEQAAPRTEQKIYFSSSLHANVEIIENGQVSGVLPCFVGYEPDVGCELRNFVYVFVVDENVRLEASHSKHQPGKRLTNYGKIIGGSQTIAPPRNFKEDTAFPLERLGSNKVLVSWTARELCKQGIKLRVVDSDTSYPAYRLAQVMQMEGVTKAPLPANPPKYIEHRVDLRPTPDEYYFLSQEQRQQREQKIRVLGDDSEDLENRLRECEASIRAALIAAASAELSSKKTRFSRHESRIKEFNQQSRYRDYVSAEADGKNDKLSTKNVALTEAVRDLLPEHEKPLVTTRSELIEKLKAQQFVQTCEAVRRVLASQLTALALRLSGAIESESEVIGKEFCFDLCEFNSAAKIVDDQLHLAGTLNMPRFTLKSEFVMGRVNAELPKCASGFVLSAQGQAAFLERASVRLQTQARLSLTKRQAEIARQAQQHQHSEQPAAPAAAAPARAQTTVSAKELLSLIATNYNETTSWHRHETGVYRSDFVRRLVKYLGEQGEASVTLQMLKENLVKEPSCFPCRLFGDAKRSKLREQALQNYDGTNTGTVLQNLEHDDQGELKRYSDRVLSAVLGKF